MADILSSGTSDVSSVDVAQGTCLMKPVADEVLLRQLQWRHAKVRFKSEDVIVQLAWQ